MGEGRYHVWTVGQVIEILAHWDLATAPLMLPVNVDVCTQPTVQYGKLQHPPDVY